MPSVVHVTEQYANNRAEVSHQPKRQRERQMRRQGLSSGYRQRTWCRRRRFCSEASRRVTSSTLPSLRNSP